METRDDAPRLLAIAKRPFPRYTSRMAHTKYEDLSDLATLLAELRAIPGLVEKKPGIIYRKGASFLHFHDKDGERWADVKCGGQWRKVDVPFKATAARRRALLVAAREAVAE